MLIARCGAVIRGSTGGMVGYVNDIADFGNGGADHAFHPAAQRRGRRCTALTSPRHQHADNAVLHVRDPDVPAMTGNRRVGLPVQHVLNRQPDFGISSCLIYGFGRHP